MNQMQIDFHWERKTSSAQIDKFIVVTTRVMPCNFGTIASLIDDELYCNIAYAGDGHLTKLRVNVDMASRATFAKLLYDLMTAEQIDGLCYSVGGK